MWSRWSRRGAISVDIVLPWLVHLELPTLPTIEASELSRLTTSSLKDGLNPADEPPFPSRLTLVDVTGGLLACEGILAALYLRQRTGQGCRVNTSLLAGAMMLQAHILKAMTSGQEAGRHLGRPLWGPLDRPVETADGLLAVAIEGEQTRRRLSEVCGLRASENRGALEKLITERLRGRSAAEWELLLLEAG